MRSWAMLTTYDMLTAALFDEVGIPVLLVGDSAGNNVLGYDSHRAGHRRRAAAADPRRSSAAARRALVVGDLPFGSYQASAEQALDTAARFLKEGGAHAVKLEGGARVLPAGPGAGRGRASR